MNVREKTLEIEERTLSPYGMLCQNTKGRVRPEEECPVRTAYQRDRDRIIHCNAFLRLKQKTQVFLSPVGDHYRTRLTHTFEVSQIARTIARGLRLNEDLTEAISLGHDLGHTPFGHAGERALNEIFPGGFKHYKQSLRVVDVIEKNGKGLNLTYEVRNGIVCHTTGTEASTLEGRVVKLADKIAYINHDIEDAIRAGVMKETDIPEEILKVLGRSKSDRINTLVISVIENSGRDITLDMDTEIAFEKLHSFMFANVYTNPICKSEESKAMDMIKRLYEYFTANPETLPGEYAVIRDRDGAERAACDYIAGMTDHYAVKTYTNLFVPNSWTML